MFITLLISFLYKYTQGIVLLISSPVTEPHFHEIQTEVVIKYVAHIANDCIGFELISSLGGVWHVSLSQVRWRQPQWLWNWYVYLNRIHSFIFFVRCSSNSIPTTILLPTYKDVESPIDTVPLDAPSVPTTEHTALPAPMQVTEPETPTPQEESTVVQVTEPEILTTEPEIFSSHNKNRPIMNIYETWSVIS